MRVYEPRLRWRIGPQVARRLRGQRILAVERRAKYLLVRLEHGTLILHLGMSGSLRAPPPGAPARTHDRYELLLDDGRLLRFEDPRRFGSLHYTGSDPARHPLLRGLAPEPLEAGFDAAYLGRIARGRRLAVKSLLLNGRLITGLGNIYAAEALFRARIDPRRSAGGLSARECARLVAAIRAALRAAIRAGGTTLRNYVGVDGNPGAFRQALLVYGCAGRPCRVCGTLILKIRQAQRSTYFCPSCQH